MSFTSTRRLAFTNNSPTLHYIRTTTTSSSRRCFYQANCLATLFSLNNNTITSRPYSKFASPFSQHHAGQQHTQKRTMASSSSPSSQPPFLVVCSVGNPGSQYANTRHSMGHIIANYLQSELNFNSWSKNSNNMRQCSIATSSSSDIPVLLYKSETYMNVSGPPIARNWQLIKRAKLAEGYEPQLVILHDELSIPLGEVKVRLRNSSPRGHNGLKSIKGVLGSSQFLSIAIGIDRPESRDQNQISNYVLAKLSAGERSVVENVAVPKVIDFLQQMSDGKYIYDSN